MVQWSGLDSGLSRQRAWAQFLVRELRSRSCMAQITKAKQTQTHGKCLQGLSVQWLRLRAPIAGAQVPSLVGERRSHMLCGAAKKKKKNWIH